MNKILVTIYVVSIDEEFDLMLPIGKTINELIESIQDSIVDLSNNNFVKKQNVLLYNSDGLIINPNNIIKYSGLKNGCKLLMI